MNTCEANTKKGGGGGERERERGARRSGTVAKNVMQQTRETTGSLNECKIN